MPKTGNLSYTPGNQIYNSNAINYFPADRYAPPIANSLKKAAVNF
ncbi:MAG: hypothetical protein AAFX53_11075 [Bacteroidota bacterium]